MSTERDASRQILLDAFAASRSVEARNAVVESYAALAEYFAARYRGRGASNEDLSQVAQLALVKAADRFDPEIGVKFSTFAGRTIDGELKRYFRDRTWPLRVPRRLKDLSIEVWRAVEELSTRDDRSPSISDIAEYLSLDQDVVVQALDVQNAYRPFSLDRPANDDESATLGDLIGSVDPALAAKLDSITVERLLSCLEERNREIVWLRFFEDMSQAEIAEKVGLSQMHVSRLLRASFKRLRNHLGELD